jgi:hypothetical protein
MFGDILNLPEHFTFKPEKPRCLGPEKKSIPLSYIGELA